MALFFRFLHSLLVFGTIFASYMVQLALLKLFRRWERDLETGREISRTPAWLARRQSRVDARNADRFLEGVLRLRGVYIKLGQVLSIMGGFLPAIYGKKLESLQDAVPPHPFDDIDAVIRKDLGPPDEVFRDIEKEPVAAASLGQVHVAYLEDDTKVAVKVLYPGIRDVVRVDLRVVGWALRVYKWFFPIQNIEAVHESLVDLLRRETDYLHEAECMRRMAADFRDDPNVLMPEVIADKTTRDVLTMTFMEGIKITRVDEIEAAGVNLDKVARRLIQAFYKQLFVYHLFHADPHPGNFLVQPIEGSDDARLVILDFGAVSEVRQEAVDGMVDVLRGFFEQNDALVLRGIEEIGFHAEGGDRALLEQTVKTYFKKLLKLEAHTPGALMRANAKELEAFADPELERRELRTLMRSVHYPEGWFYVERASVMMFWLCGNIAPDVDPMQIGFPYVLPLLAERIRQRTDRPPAERPVARP